MILVNFFIKNKIVITFFGTIFTVTVVVVSVVLANSNATTDFITDYCQENYGRNLNSTAWEYASYLADFDFNISIANPNDCCKSCTYFENSTCDFYTIKKVKSSYKCFQYSFKSVPENFSLNIMIGLFYEKDNITGKSIIYKSGSIGFTNSFLAL